MCQTSTEKITLRVDTPWQHQIFGWIFRITIGSLLWPLAVVWRSVGDTIMKALLRRTYIYNVSWEDPRIDRRQLNLDETDHVITLASAGNTIYDWRWCNRQQSSCSPQLCCLCSCVGWFSLCFIERSRACSRYAVVLHASGLWHKSHIWTFHLVWNLYDHLMDPFQLTPSAFVVNINLSPKRRNIWYCKSSFTLSRSPLSEMAWTVAIERLLIGKYKHSPIVDTNQSPRREKTAAHKRLSNPSVLATFGWRKYTTATNRVMAVCAGDNALDYVIEGANVSAVDFNPGQIALCELKVHPAGPTGVRGVQRRISRLAVLLPKWQQPIAAAVFACLGFVRKCRARLWSVSIFGPILYLNEAALHPIFFNARWPGGG